jgi:hypothetical protein
MQAIRTRYIGPTKVRGSRIQAKCEAKTIYMSYDHGLNLDENHRQACEILLCEMNWLKEHGRYSEMVGGSFDRDMYWVFSDDIKTRASSSKAAA